MHFLMIILVLGSCGSVYLQETRKIYKNITAEFNKRVAGKSFKIDEPELVEVAIGKDTFELNIVELGGLDSANSVILNVIFDSGFTEYVIRAEFNRLILQGEPTKNHSNSVTISNFKYEASFWQEEDDSYILDDEAVKENNLIQVNATISAVDSKLREQVNKEVAEEIRKLLQDDYSSLFIEITNTINQILIENILENHSLYMLFK